MSFPRRTSLGRGNPGLIFYEAREGFCFPSALEHSYLPEEGGMINLKLKFCGKWWCIDKDCPCEHSGRLGLPLGLASL